VFETLAIRAELNRPGAPQARSPDSR
jgi:hypothetical protein